MEVQPLVQASVERPRRTEPRCVAPLNGANTICTNKCRPGQTLEMEREQLSRASPHNNILYICPNAKVIRINERNHYDGDLQKHRATHVQKAFPAAEMRLVSSVRFSSSVLQPPIDKGLRTSIHSCRMAVDCLTSTSLGCMTETKKQRAVCVCISGPVAMFAHIAFESGKVNTQTRPNFRAKTCGKPCLSHHVEPMQDFTHLDWHATCTEPTTPGQHSSSESSRPNS